MTEHWGNGVARLYEADAREIPLPDASAHCVVTSPPYWGLRDYSIDEGIGLEATLAEHLDSLVCVFRELRRVLRDDGTVWLNYGDAYAGSWGAQSRGYGDPNGTSSVSGGQIHAAPKDTHTGSSKRTPGLKPKDLMGLPWRVAFALQDDGWWLRSAIVWHKPNPMPESVRDRPTNAYEMVFLLAKQPKYYMDMEAIRLPTSGRTDPITGFGKKGSTRPDKDNKYHLSGNVGANARNVWTIPTQGRPDAHFATFPDELPRRCILAGTSERGVCAECGAPWERVVEMTPEYKALLESGKAWRDDTGKPDGEANRQPKGHPAQVPTKNQTTGWQPTCDHDGDTVPATVLDPFVGSGTTVAVAQALGRRGIGLDLNPEYLEIAKRRIGAVPLPMF